MGSRRRQCFNRKVIQKIVVRTRPDTCVKSPLAHSKWIVIARYADSPAPDNARKYRLAQAKRCHPPIGRKLVPLMDLQTPATWCHPSIAKNGGRFAVSAGVVSSHGQQRLGANGPADIARKNVCSSELRGETRPCERADRGFLLATKHRPVWLRGSQRLSLPQPGSVSSPCSSV